MLDCRDPDTGVVIARCSQPELGWFGSRFEEDEVMVDEILKACIMDRNKGKLSLILRVDLRKEVGGGGGGVVMLLMG